MNLALALAVAGLSLSAVRVFVTCPASHVRMWMLLVWRTPPRSDLFEAPARSLLIVVSLLPKASRKAYGKVRRVKRLIRQLRNGFFYFNGVQLLASP